MDRDPFKEYLRESEPDKAYKSYVWSKAIGLQAVDRLKPSEYLIDTAIQNIEGKITMKEAQELIDRFMKKCRCIHLLMNVQRRQMQIHIFGEGNTRTTAVFFIKYLRTLGFSATNDIFAENA